MNQGMNLPTMWKNKRENTIPEQRDKGLNTVICRKYSKDNANNSVDKPVPIGGKVVTTNNKIRRDI